MLLLSRNTINNDNSFPNRFEQLQVRKIIQEIYNGSMKRLGDMLKVGVVGLENATDNQTDKTPLNAAIEFRDAEFVTEFIKLSKCSTRQQSALRKLQPLHVAIQKGNIEICKVLAERNADFKCKDINDESNFHRES
ncbi:MAG: Ankyrin repeat and EF-hand [Marteilia pararefringens]